MAQSPLPKELFRVLPPTEALSRLLEHLPRGVLIERVPLARALDRVLAEDLVSPIDLPDFARSTMDGFAVRAADTFGASEGLPAHPQPHPEPGRGQLLPPRRPVPGRRHAERP